MLGSLLRRWSGRHRGRDALEPLYRAVVATARQPVWFTSGGVADTREGRLDMLLAILALVLIRLEEEGEPGRPASALLAELFVDDMDGQLRQSGVGDLVVGKRIGHMMGALGGRVGALREGMADQALLDGAIERNLLAGRSTDPGAIPVLRDGLVSLMAALRATPAAELADGAWRP